MNYNIIPTDNFNREVKKLAKKYLSLRDDLLNLRTELENNPTTGTHLGHNIYKIRIAISSKGKGKSGGARIISYVFMKNKEVFLLTIYDKSEKENITEKDIRAFIEELNL